jgi:hypothetical protein
MLTWRHPRLPPSFKITMLCFLNSSSLKLQDRMELQKYFEKCLAQADEAERSKSQ